MSEVVKLDPANRPRNKAAAERRKRASKTALVLGGGGFTGAVYEIGALRAFDLLAANKTVNQFDIYVGTSAGALIGSAVANGVPPEEMMRVLNKRLPSPLQSIDRGTIMRPNYDGFLKAAALFPLRFASVLRSMAATFGETSVMDFAVGLASALPAGLYSGSKMEDYVAEMLSDPDRTNDFRLLDRELYLTATNLDSAERVVLGDAGWEHVPISRAVAASTALPMVYEPVEIDGDHFIDGGLRSTTNVDIAVEKGAKFIVVVNPLVPFVNDFSKQVATLSGKRPRHVADMGFMAIANQTFRLMSHDRLHKAVDDWERRYPGVDILLIEPEFDDELMFATSIMDYSARLQIAKHGFESVTLRLARDYDRYRAIAQKHGIEISARRIRHVLDQVERERSAAPAWRRVFEQTTSALLR